MRLPQPSGRACISALAVAIVAMASSVTVADAQSSLPATPGTTSGGATPANQAGRQRHVEVQFANGLLTVSATDASLNQVVREIALSTGMHVTGAVADVPVFGAYGPAQPATILSTLLDGTGSNFLLVDATAGAPAQLTLTPRVGGVTPPDPHAAAREEEDRNHDLFSRSPEAPLALPGGRPGFVPPGGPPPTSQTAGQTNNPAQPTSVNQPVIFPPISTTGTPATSTTTPADPDADHTNGIKTPQQIFEQLQRLRQQQTQTTTSQ